MPVLVSPPPSGPPSNNTSALLFNGTSQHVTIPNTPVNPNADFTIEAWVRLLVHNSSNVIFAGQQDGNNYWMLINRSDGNGLCFQQAVASGSATFIGAGVAALAVADLWVHVALTRSGNTWNFYKNGVLLKTASSSQIGFLGAQAIARLTASAVYFSGFIDEVRTWDIARTEAEILASKSLVLPGSTANMTGYWRFETGSGTVATDTDAAGNHGTLVNAPAWTIERPVF